MEETSWFQRYWQAPECAGFSSVIQTRDKEYLLKGSVGLAFGVGAVK